MWTAALTLLAALPSQDAVATPAQDDALAGALTQCTERAVRAADHDGVVVQVDLGGETVFSYGAGYAPGGARIAPDAVFRAEPLFDVFTVAAALDLVARGKLRLDAPISELLPAFAELEDAPTVVQLMDHSSGLIGWTRGLDGTGDAEPTSEVLVGLAAELGLQSPPGTCFEYSESNGLLLAAIVETVTGKPIAEVIESRLFAGVELENTGFGLEDAPPMAAEAAATREIAGRLVDIPDVAHPFGEQDLCTTAGDLVTLARAMGAGDIVPARAVTLMKAPRRLEDGTPTGVGLGLNRARLEDLEGFSVGGSAEGTTVHVVRYPEVDLTIAVAAVHERADLPPLARDLARLTLGRPLDAAEKGIDLPDETAERVVGTWQIGCTSLFVRQDAEGGLLLEEAGRATRHLSYLGALTFVDRDDRDVRFEFHAPADDARAQSLTIVEHDRRIEAVRLD